MLETKQTSTGALPPRSSHSTTAIAFIREGARQTKTYTTKPWTSLLDGAQDWKLLADLNKQLSSQDCQYQPQARSCALVPLYSHRVHNWAQGTLGGCSRGGLREKISQIRWAGNWRQTAQLESQGLPCWCRLQRLHGQIHHQATEGHRNPGSSPASSRQNPLQCSWTGKPVTLDKDKRYHLGPIILSFFFFFSPSLFALTKEIHQMLFGLW